MSKNSKTKVLLINQHFYPDIGATGQFLTDLAEDLADMGLELTVLTGVPSYSKEVLKLDVPKEEIYKGKLKIIRVSNTRFKKSSLIGRILNYLTFYTLASWKAVGLPKQDIVIVLSTPPLIASLGVLISILKKSKLVYYVKDVYPDIAVSLGVIRTKILIRIMEFITKRIYRKSDAIVAIGKDMKAVINGNGNKTGEEKIFIVNDWADGSEIFPIDKERNPFLREKNLDGKFIIQYSGNMGLAHEFKAITEAMEILKEEEDILFLFIGDGIRKRELERFVRENMIKNVKFLPYQTRENLLYSLNACDISIISLRKEALGLCVPSKIYGILAAGKPVIAICPSGCEVADIIRGTSSGLRVNEGDGKELANAILTLYWDKSLRERMGNNARKALLEKYDRKLATKRYYALLKNLSSVSKTLSI